MDKSRYAITFACYGQLAYTRRCIDSMVRAGTPLDRVVVVDNASRDGTPQYLASLPLGACILNRENLGCGVAWNQGALALQAEWTIVMNNDVIVSEGWVDKLIGAAESHGLRVMSPALVEGALDYDFEAFAAQASERMRGVVRIGWCHAVCLAIHRSVWQEVGYFPPVPRLLGYEDTLFFNDMEAAGVAGGMTGAVWLHHFGSITQRAMKLERGLAEDGTLGSRYNYKLLGKSWLERKMAKLRRTRRLQAWREQERAAYGMALHGYSHEGRILWD
jgi:glycosyltransferase involved in cell wall biosynthesis